SPRRETGSREHHVGSAQPRVGRQPFPVRLFVRRIVIRMAAADRRQREDRLRLTVARHVQEDSAAGGGCTNRGPDSTKMNRTQAFRLSHNYLFAFWLGSSVQKTHSAPF